MRRPPASPSRFLSGSNTRSLPLSPIPDSIISPHLSRTPETMVLDIGKHTFNYPWPHISLKYLHCTTPQGDAVHDLSSNLFMGHLQGRDLLPPPPQYVHNIYIYIHFVVKSWKSLAVMFVTRHACQIQVSTRQDVAFFQRFGSAGLWVSTAFYPRTHTREGT